MLLNLVLAVCGHTGGWPHVALGDVAVHPGGHLRGWLGDVDDLELVLS